MTTQPLAPSLTEPTSSPILGVTGPVSDVVPIVKQDQDPTVPGVEFLWKSFTMSTGSTLNGVLWQANIFDSTSDGRTFLPSPDILRYMFSSEIYPIGYKLRFEAIKLDGGEARLRVNYTYRPGGVYNITPVVETAYQVQTEFTVSHSSVVNEVMVDLAVLNQPSLVYIYKELPFTFDPTPNPFTTVQVVLSGRYQITPIQPTTFDILVYATPMFINMGRAIPDRRSMVHFQPTKSGSNTLTSFFIGVQALNVTRPDEDELVQEIETNLTFN